MFYAAYISAALSWTVLHFTSFIFLLMFNIFVGDIDSEIVSSASLPLTLSCVVQ